MSILSRRSAVPVVLLVASGCASTVTTAVDRRPVIGEAAFPSRVSEGGSTPDQAAVNIGGRQFLVTASEVKWSGRTPLDDPANWNAVGLPTSWHRVELKQSAAGVAVVVDGRSITVVRPAA